MNQKLITKSNFVLSQVLNSDDSLDILQDFIEAILKIKIEDIKLNNHNKNEGDMLASRQIGIADVRIKTEEKDEMNVGIQIIDGKYSRHTQVGFEAGVYYKSSYARRVHGAYAVDEERKFPAELHAEAYQAQCEYVYKGLLPFLFHQ